MERTKFLKEISSMSREDIDKYLLRNCNRRKKIYPVLVLKPYSKKESTSESRRLMNNDLLTTKKHMILNHKKMNCLL